MEALKRKWNSNRGASILLALLFLLVCMMVGASILAAAASNAGKIRSNKTEQQKYLTLSSALTLLCDELESVEYVGQYTHTKSTTKQYEDPDDPTSDVIAERTVHTYAQQTGKLQHQDPPAHPPISADDWGNLQKLLPLFNNLDSIVKPRFNSTQTSSTTNDGVEYITEYIYKSDISLPDPLPGSYTVELKVNGNNYGGLSDDKVKIEVALRQDGSIILTAVLMEKQSDGTWKETNYTMNALLESDVDPRNLEAPAKNAGSSGNIGTVIWTMKYIYKE